MYIKRLEFDNLRTFERAEVEFNYPDRPLGPVKFDNVNLLLGDNASGKTTVLKAVALGTLAPLLAGSSGFVPYSLVRRKNGSGSEMASVKAAVQFGDGDKGDGPDEDEGALHLTALRASFQDRLQWEGPSPGDSRLVKHLWEGADPGYLVLGYGATRRVEPDVGSFSEEQRLKSRAVRYLRVASLFEESVTLVPFSAWLPRLRDRKRKTKKNPSLRPERYTEILGLLNELLAPHANIPAQPKSDDILVEVNSIAVPSGALSDGYRAFLGWTGDLLYHLVAATPDDCALRDQSGIVLVDEIDLHLHPEWQQRVIPTVARAFPKLQFIFTSHSPLVVGSLRQANVFVLERDERGVSQIKPSPSEVYGLSADQILTSEHFGLRSTRAEPFAQDLRDQAHKAQSGDPEAALKLLRMMTLGSAAEETEDHPSTEATSVR
jgi:AAA domain, putative AbiEii toxin, Type IV TA system/AAA domain